MKQGGSNKSTVYHWRARRLSLLFRLSCSKPEHVTHESILFRKNPGKWFLSNVEVHRKSYVQTHFQIVSLYWSWWLHSAIAVKCQSIFKHPKRVFCVYFSCADAVEVQVVDFFATNLFSDKKLASNPLFWISPLCGLPECSFTKITCFCTAVVMTVL